DRLLSYHHDERVLRSRLATCEQKFAAGDITLADYESERDTLNARIKEVATALGEAPHEAKRQLLDYGSGISLMGNAVHGVIGGIITMLLFQLAIPFLSAAHSGAADAIAQVTHQLVPIPYTVELLKTCAQLINAAGVFILSGFLFGYAFPAVRGEDGY